MASKEINGNPGGRGVFGLGNPGGRGGLVVLKIRVEGGVKKSCHPSGGGGGVCIFSGITQSKDAQLLVLFSLSTQSQ